MDQRLLQFLKAENITQSQFADNLGIAKASVSHLLAGRNKPSFEMIEKIAAVYPALSLEWLITGSGRMYKSGNGENSPENAYEILDLEPETDSQPKVSTLSKRTQRLKGQRNISKIVVFFDDGTFQELTQE